MNCSAEFFYANPSNHFYFPKSGCTEIKNFMENLSRQDQKTHYISSFTIHTSFPPNQTHKTFGPFVPLATFECLLNCAMQSSSRIDQITCSKICEMNATSVRLNHIDKFLQSNSNQTPIQK